MGVTRLSLGVENFDDRILEINGRAHRSPEIGRPTRCARGARLPADQHRPDRRHARRDRGQLAALRREDARARARQRHHLPDGAAVQHDDQQGPAAEDRTSSTGAGRRLADQAALGGARRSTRSSAPAITSAAPTRGQGSGADAVRLPRSPVAGRRHGRPRRRLVRPRQRRPRAEPGHVGDLQRGDRRGELPLGRAYRRPPTSA